jgi:hypothetical protein
VLSRACPSCRYPQLCVSGRDLVETAAALSYLGHAPSPAWTEAWYGALLANRRLAALPRGHLCMAVRLQRQLPLAPPRAWLVAAARALAAEEGAEAPPPAQELLAAAAELQRLGAAEALLAEPVLPAGCDASADASQQQPSLAEVAAAASAGLSAQLAVAEPWEQLEAVRSLTRLLASCAQPERRPSHAQHIRDSAAGAPTANTAAEGWVTGALALAHAAVAARAPRAVLAGLRAGARGRAFASSAAIATCGPAGLVELLRSMARAGHSPGPRWLGGVARLLLHEMDGGVPDAGSGAAPDADLSPGEAGAAGAADAGAQPAGWALEDAARAVVCLAALGYVPAADVAAGLQARLLPALHVPAPPASAGSAGTPLAPALAAELCLAWAAVRRHPPPAWWDEAERGALRAAALRDLPPRAALRLPHALAAAGRSPPPTWLAALLAALPPALAELHAARARGGWGSDGGGGGGAEADVSQLAWALGWAVHEGGHAPALLSESGALQVRPASRMRALPPACGRQRPLARRARISLASRGSYLLSGGASSLPVPL